MLFALAILESATLSALLLAVPLKHLMHQPQYVAVLGPVHGMVFVLYASAVLRTPVPGRSLRTRLLLLVAGFVPFGGIVAASRLRTRRERG